MFKDLQGQGRHLEEEPISNKGGITNFPQSSCGPVPLLEEISAPFKMTNVIQMSPVITGKGRLLVIKHFPHPTLCILAKLRERIYKNQRTMEEWHNGTHDFSGNRYSTDINKFSSRAIEPPSTIVTVL